MLPISFAFHLSCQFLFTACDPPLSFLPSHGTASSVLPACSHHSTEQEGSWSLLLECIIRFYMWKLLFSWRPVPGGCSSSAQQILKACEDPSILSPVSLPCLKPLEAGLPFHFALSQLLYHSECSFLQGFSGETRRNQPHGSHH